MKKSLLAVAVAAALTKSSPTVVMRNPREGMSRDLEFDLRRQLNRKPSWDAAKPGKALRKRFG